MLLRKIPKILEVTPLPWNGSQGSIFGFLISRVLHYSEYAPWNSTLTQKCTLGILHYSENAPSAPNSRHPSQGPHLPRHRATIVRHPRSKMIPTTTPTTTNETTLAFLQALADGDPNAESEFYDDRAEFEATFGEYDWDGLG